MRRLLWPLMFLSVTAIASLLLLSVEAPAQGYRYNYYNYSPPSCYQYYGSQQYTYTQPTYSAPTYAPSYAPTYEKVYPAQKVIAQEIAVAPLIVTVPVESKAVPVHAYGSPYYYSVSEAYREKAYLREVLREELRNLLSTGGVTPTAPPRTGGYGTPSTTPSTTAPSTTPSTTAPATTGWVADTTTPAELQAKVLAAYQGKANCVSCHGGGGRDSGNFKLVLDDGKGGYTLTKQTGDKRWKIYGMSSVGAMPPSAATDASKAMETTHLPSLLQYAAQKD